MDGAHERSRARRRSRTLHGRVHRPYRHAKAGSARPGGSGIWPVPGHFIPPQRPAGARTRLFNAFRAAHAAAGLSDAPGQTDAHPAEFGHDARAQKRAHPSRIPPGSGLFPAHRGAAASSPGLYERQSGPHGELSAGPAHGVPDDPAHSADQHPARNGHLPHRARPDRTGRPGHPRGRCGWMDRRRCLRCRDLPGLLPGQHLF